MKKNIVKQRLPEIVRKIADGFKPEKIILFGSYAWGKPGPDSDVDLFVVKDTKQNKIERGVAVEKLLWGIKVPVDVLIYTPKEIEQRFAIDDPFIRHIFSRGRTLYSLN